MKTNVIVTKADIEKIGYTAHSNDGLLAIITSPETAGIEEILLRSILKCWGDYHITEVNDFAWEETPNKVDVEIQTNLPYDAYCEWRKLERD